LKPLGETGEKLNGDNIRAMYLVDSVLTKNYGITGQPDWRLVRCEDATYNYIKYMLRH
jgi:hypothetical protein